MTPYEQALAERAPELDPVHMETLAYSMSRTLNGQPASFFDAVARKARQMGPAKLAAWHEMNL